MRPVGAVLWQYLIPQKLVCRFVYRAARSTRPWFARPLIRWFATHYALDMTEAEQGSLEAYASLNALFTRALKPGARPAGGGADAIVSPADGRLTAFGGIGSGRLVQAKGIDYSAAALIGEAATALEGGTFATIYLAPHNYHRVHAPIAARLMRTRFIAGRRFSVNSATAAAIPDLFCRNERAVLRLERDDGFCHLVMVGALNVSSISTTDCGEFPSGVSDCREAGGVELSAGEEVGRFNLGSTVILLFPPGRATWSEGLCAGQAVRVGERLGTLARGHGG